MSGSLPSHIFVVRHGNRLDTAVKDWHLTTATPYDSPLTYGGFLQARQVGQRIASLLDEARSRDQEPSRPGIPRKLKRFRVIVHSSLYLRCIQTSIGIASGLSHGSTVFPLGPGNLFIPYKSPRSPPDCFTSCLLRLDSFLAEWQSINSPDSPPSTANMVEMARAELLRPAEYVSPAVAVSNERPFPRSDTISTPGAGSSRALRASDSERNGEERASMDLSALGKVLPVAPLRTPSYAPLRPLSWISTNGEIPPGFVAHARDGCIKPDLCWDSNGQIINFGGSGESGEEWPEMLKRFRLGLKKMLNWYATADLPARPRSEIVASCREPPGALGSSPPRAAAKEEETDTETVVILVSHGAGCNALLGAITDEPILMDVGLASISMATRKPGLDYARLLLRAASPAGGPAGERLVSVSDMYDLQMSASTEHLRSLGSSSVPSISMATSTSDTGHEGQNRDATRTQGTLRSRSKTPPLDQGASFPRSSRSATVGLPPGRGTMSPFPALSRGLWSPASSPTVAGGGDGDVSEDSDEAPSSGQARAVITSAQAGAETTVHAGAGTAPEEETAAEVVLRPFTGGLWGTSARAREAETREASQPKRRWTVNEGS